MKIKNTPRIKSHILALAISAAVGLLTGCGSSNNNTVSSGSEQASVAGESRSVNSANNEENSSSEITSSDASSSSVGVNTDAAKYFNRKATFAVCIQDNATCNKTYELDDSGQPLLDSDGERVEFEAVAEIVAASTDGMTLIYTDSPQDQIGFVDITNIATPKAAGVLNMGGEPTSVAVVGDYAVVGVNTSTDFINTSGHLAVVDIAVQKVVHTIDMKGQPDSVAVSPNGKYIAIAIENERDEDLEVAGIGEGYPPQLPAGFLMIVDVKETVTDWEIRKVELAGVPVLYAGDPEPEYVDINQDSLAVLTMQENNHIALIDLIEGKVVSDFSAGEVDLVNIDLTEEEPALIKPTETKDAVLREPDGVTWIGTDHFATANEGDLDGGSRGFTIFKADGSVTFESGSLDHIAIRHGHYPDARSKNKGNEPENVEYAVLGETPYLFVNSERANLVFVYDVTDPTAPVYKQALPAGVGPEGALAIPSRDLLIVASEKDSRSDKLRSVLTLYSLEAAAPNYPTLKSANQPDSELPIAWGAMSGLVAGDENTVYSIEDSFYRSNRIFTIDVSKAPAAITSAMAIKDTNGVFAAVKTYGATEDKTQFDATDLEALINDDKTVNIDPEGIAVATGGGFWVASEGSGTFDDKSGKRPVVSHNFVFKTNQDGVIEKVVTLPKAVSDVQLRFGFEGVAEDNGKLYVAFQCAWNSEANPRIGIYDIASQEWRFVFYPLDAPESQNGGWVGLSDITAMGNGQFLVLERDNQGGFDAAIKRLYQIDLSSAVADSTITKTLVRDVMDDLKKPNGMVYEKIEGSALMPNGDVYIINDNDGVDDNSGETQLIKIEGLMAREN